MPGWGIVLEVCVVCAAPWSLGEGPPADRIFAASARPAPTIALTWQGGTATAPAATREQMLNLRAHFCDLVDEQGRTLYNPLLEDVWAADRALFWRWMQMLRDGGATHVILHVGEGGQSYHGDGTLPQNIWPDPDDWSHLDRYVELLRAIVNTPSASGAGFTPIVFLDSGDANPLPRIGDRWPRFFTAVRAAGLMGRIIVVPAFEPVEGAWRALEVSRALELIHRLAPDVLLGYHGSPRRLVGSSTCDPKTDRRCAPGGYDPDDPWRGQPADFYRSHGGQWIDIALYQTEHGDSLYRACAATDERCEAYHLNEYVLRIGAGYRGWRKLPLAIMETTAYEAIRGLATPQDAVDVATRLKQVCDKPAAPDYAGGPVACGWGNGLPR
jgi:hypothetical protein